MRKALLVFAVMALAQWLLPIFTIKDHEQVLREGVPLLFQTAPIDPHDPFRGEYVTLRFTLEDSLFDQDMDDPFEHGDQVVVLFRDLHGEAVIDGIQRDEPVNNGPWCFADVNVWNSDDSMRFQIDLPFDRYYLEQGTGRRTEELVQRWPGATDGEPAPLAHALVRIWNGRAVIEDLLSNGESVRKIILEEREADQSTSEPVKIP